VKRLTLLGVLVPALVWGVSSEELTKALGVTEAWVIRAQQAVAWSQGKQAPVTVDEVAAEFVSRLNAVVVQQEQARGIDPETGEATPARLVADLQAARSAKEAAERVLTAALAEADSVRGWTAVLAVRPDGRICVGETDCEQSATPEEVVQALQDYAAQTAQGAR